VSCGLTRSWFETLQQRDQPQHVRDPPPDAQLRLTRPVRTTAPLRSGLDAITVSTTIRSRAMYDMYPDWGPAHHRPENPGSPEAGQASLDPRDHGDERPDDN